MRVAAKDVHETKSSFTGIVTLDVVYGNITSMQEEMEVNSIVDKI